MRFWYIAVDRGPLNGFQRYQTKRDIELTGVEMDVFKTVQFQELNGGEILPGKDYFLYFAFNAKAPVEGFVKLKVVQLPTIRSYRPPTTKSFQPPAVRNRPKLS